MQARPQKGQGQRWWDCYYYDSCLDLAALKNWKAFHCESCSIYNCLFKHTPEHVTKNDERACRSCGVNRTIQPSSPLCASCIGKKAWEGGDKRKKALRRLKMGKTTNVIRAHFRSLNRDAIRSSQLIFPSTPPS